MTEFTVKLADIPIRISACYSETKAFLQEYLCEEPETFSISIHNNDMEFERQRMSQINEKEGSGPINYSEVYLENLAVHRKIAERLLDYDVLLFHGSAVAVDGEVYLFAARSGTGKSTHARLWRSYFGSRAVMVNDDKPFLKFTDKEILVCGSPWNGKHRLSEPIMLQLKALALLSRDERNHVEKTDICTAFPFLLKQCYHSSDSVRMARVLSMLEQLGQRARLYELGCNMEIEAARISYEGMQGEEND